MLISTDELNLFCSLNIEKYNTQLLTDAYSLVKKIAKKHYENFPVASILVPKRTAKYIYAIYSFSRIADDIADEISKTNSSEALFLLNKYEDCLVNCLTENKINNPIFLALKDTILENNLTLEPFKQLLKAFRKDINFKQPDTFDDLFDYCNCSANPIGELLLRLFNEYNDRTIYYSNKICTALQLINFLQDISIDINRNRNYIPKTLLTNSKIDEQVLNKYISISEELLTDGREILKLVSNFRLRCELRLIIFGGEIMLKKIKKNKKKLLEIRPKLFL